MTRYSNYMKKLKPFSLLISKKEIYDESECPPVKEPIPKGTRVVFIRYRHDLLNEFIEVKYNDLSYFAKEDEFWKVNRAEDLLWPKKEIPFIPGDYYDADRRK